MDAKHIEIGKNGELLAKNLLESKGYKILATNWRYKRSEVDIIAKDGETLVFIEVKTRSSTQFSQPEDFVSRKKEFLLSAAASAYMDEFNHNWAIRFDIITVIISKNLEPIINHMEDAFFPGIA